MQDLALYLEEKRELVNRAIEGFLPDLTSSSKVEQAMRYSLLAGGKRLRPILLLTGAEVCGGNAIDLLPSACALEFIHTYSLIHDDLPAMDDDDFRRGKPTCHKAFGEAVAILAGDALLTAGFQLLVRQSASRNMALVLRVIEEVSSAAGYQGMVGGQELDLAAENTVSSAELLKDIHAKKTGALFQAALRAGGILVGADAAKLSALTSYARHFGLAFQITDDILDVVGETAKLGKTAGSDLKKLKATYPQFYGLQGAKAEARKEVRAAVEAAGYFGEKGWPLAELARYLLERQN